MSFVHDDRDFDGLLRIVADKKRLSLGLIEKDYWVTHALWGLHAQGFEVWFKGGTSLSKGFGIIERFSEDLDLKIESGAVADLPRVSNWKSKGTTATAERKTFFEMLTHRLQIPGTTVSLDPEQPDPESWRTVNIRVRYPGGYLGDLGGVMRDYVRLEVGHARVTPFVLRNLSSFVHDQLGDQAAQFDANSPNEVRCIHPLVTLLEKLDAIHKRVPGDAEPATFVRHFEDAACIIAKEGTLPPLGDGYADVRALAADMLAEKQIKVSPASRDPAFALRPGTRTDATKKAHADIRGMFWGPRTSLEDACVSIRGWIAKRLE